MTERLSAEAPKRGLHSDRIGLADLRAWREQRGA
jgi:hypothetical protein